MLITIRVLNVHDGDAQINGTPPRKLLCARGFMPNSTGAEFPWGQVLIESGVREGHDWQTQSAAKKEIVDWLRQHRPSYTVMYDGAAIWFHCSRCGNQTCGTREAGIDYCNACGGVL